MSDEPGRDYPGGDPFVDPHDPAAVEREERRRAREAKRAEKKGRKAKREPAPPPPPKAPAAPRTPEQEFWDEPGEPVPPPGEEPGRLTADAEKAEKGRRRLLRRRKGAAAAGAAGAAAGGAAAAQGAPPPPTGERPAPPAPPTGEGPAPSAPTGEQSAPPTGEQPSPPPTGEQPAAQAPPATGEPPVADSPAPTTDESPRPDAEPPSDEVPRGATEEAPRPDPGADTAEAPRRDPEQPTGESAFPATAEHAVPAGEGGTATREHRAPPPRPVEETGAGDWEPPPPRDDWFEGDELHDEGDPRMAGAAAGGRRHGDDDGRRGGFLGAILGHPFRIIGAIVLILVLVFLNALFQPFHGEGHGRVEVTIPKGSSVGEVGDLLEKEGVISNSTLFQIRVTLAGDRSNLIAGKYTLAKDMSYGSAIDALSTEPEPSEPAKSATLTVTIPEGESRPLAAKLVKEDGLKGSYLKSTKKSKYLNPEKYGGKHVKSLEGFLYPDTWELKRGAPVSRLVRLQLEDFNRKIKKVDMKYAKSKNLTIFDVVTIASMIEREAGVPKQRKLVSSVIYNRLHEGMPLGIDSTIRFATGNYEQPLTQSQLESSSPYNTRTHTGLPPGPINSPGLAALQAAAHPARTEYLFYVNNPNSCNELTFAKTEEEFFADAAKYEKAREANGGNQPTTCKE